jgi:hypothetical protein
MHLLVGLLHLFKSSEIFPSDYTAYRDDRGSLGGGVFILVNNNIIATEQVQYNTSAVYCKYSRVSLF